MCVYVCGTDKIKSDYMKSKGCLPKGRPAFQFQKKITDSEAGKKSRRKEKMIWNLI